MSKNFRNFILTNLKLYASVWMAGTAALIFFACSSVRHALFKSGAFDLGIFDQAIYLISQGKPPISSFIGFHILGDHAALILYPLALFYKIYPNVHWLLAVQALALALGAVPAWKLARIAGLKESVAIAIAAIYLLYPLVFNLNLFDFHPEVLALPAFLAAILAARLNKIGWFCAAIALILSCKAALALTVLAMGIWLLFFEKKRACGAIALFSGAAWFLIATQAIIPSFGSEAASVARHIPRYSYLGASFSEIARNAFLKPGLIFSKIFSLATLEYLALLILPVIWGLSPRHLAPLISALPALLMNILSETASQRNLVQQYSLPVLPFLLLAVIASLEGRRGEGEPGSRGAEEPGSRGEGEPGSRGAEEQRSRGSGGREKELIQPAFAGFVRVALPFRIRNQTAKAGFVRVKNSPSFLIAWSFIAFLALAKYGYFGSSYLDSLDTWKATREAIAQIPPQVSVLTTHEISPHLAQRSLIKFTDANSSPADLNEFDYILLNVRHPGWLGTREFAASLVDRIKNTQQFQPIYQQDDVYLFIKK